MRDGKMQYPTAEEACYPYLFCERIIACVLTEVRKMGAIHIDKFQQRTELRQFSRDALQWVHCQEDPK